MAGATDWMDYTTEYGINEWDWGFTWSWSGIVRLILACVGLVGNLLVILALVRRKTHKHTVDIFIGALAGADFFTSIFAIPFPVAWRLPSTHVALIYCKLMYTNYFMFVGIGASAYTLTGMAIERFVAVVYPLHRNSLFTRRRIYTFLALVWIFALLASGFVFTITVIDNTCTDTLSPQAQKAIPYYLFCIRILIPALIMFVTQTLTALTLHRQSKVLIRTSRSTAGDSAGKPSFHITARDQVVKMMFVVILVFILSVSPNYLFLLVVSSQGGLLSFLGSPLHRFMSVLAFVNSSANPFIYAARYPKFRSAIKEMFTGATSGATPLFDQGVNPTSSRQKKQNDESSTAISNISQTV